MYARLLAIAFLALAPLSAASADWRPKPGLLFDLQLTAPYDLGRIADAIVLEPFNTSRERLAGLRAHNVAALCYLSAGRWQNWRPDAANVAVTALGRSPSAWRGERWLDVRDPSVTSVLELRLDLCRDRGFVGVLLGDVDGYARNTGFTISADDQLTFNRRLAMAAHARGLSVGLVNDLAQAAGLARDFDFLVADNCVTFGDCAEVEPFLSAGKLVQLVAYTNRPDRMASYCNLAAEIGAPLIFKTQSLNGKVHRRCG
jgi:hypothetical protein